MAKRHLVEYYKKVCSQYQNMNDTLKKFENELQYNMVDPQIIENAKKIIAPLKANYERISYIMFLLNQPNKESKKKRYVNQNKCKLNGLDKNNSIEKTLEENEDVIKNLDKVNKCFNKEK